MSVVLIREARLDDLPCLAAIEQSGVETFERAGIPLADRSQPGPPDQWGRALHAGLLWVADDPASGPIGFVAGALEGDSLYIEAVDVVMSRQKQGHGAGLMRQAIDWAKARGLAAVTLTTFRSIPWNGPFYAGLGFAELAPAETPAWLAAILAKEAARGFEDRCAMRLAL